MVGQTGSAASGVVLGTPFLRQYYTYFDFASKTVGFAKSLSPPYLVATTNGAVNVGWIAVATIVVTLFGILLISAWIYVDWY